MKEKSQVGESFFADRIGKLVAGASIKGRAGLWQISNTDLHNYLRGTIPRGDKLLKIARAAGVSMDWLAGREGATREFAVGDKAAVAALAPSATQGKGRGDELVEVAVWRGGERGLDYLIFRAEYLRARLRIDPRELTLVPVDDDSAAPQLARGGVCLCHRRSPAADGLWAVEAVGGRAAFRKIYANKNSVQIFRPDAAGDVPPLEQTTPAAFARDAIGRVVWRGGEIF